MPEADIRRRFDRGLRNLMTQYHECVDAWVLFDNSTGMPRLVASADGGKTIAWDAALFEKISGGLK